MIQRSSTWSFQERDALLIGDVLTTLLQESNARCALLVDRNGQLVTTAGERSDLDSTSFASLAAADFSANDQLASLIGEPAFSSLFHQGEKESMYLTGVGERLILVVLFDGRAAPGMIRLKVRAAANDLARTFEELFARAPAPAAMSALESTWANEAEDEIDRLFGSL